MVVADDSAQQRPSRAGLASPVYGAGALLCDGDGAGLAESRLDELCDEFGFPADEEFKWSPSRDTWMRANLREDARLQFFLQVLGVLAEFECKVIVVAVDSGYPRATANDELPRNQDAFRLLIGHLTRWLEATDELAVMVMDEPGGGSKERREFLASCTRFAVELARDRRRIIVAPLPAESGRVRLVQAADLVTSCTVAYLSGEPDYSPPVFAQVTEMLCSHNGRKGRTGLVLHPSYRYLNLHHWLVGDETYGRGGLVAPLPIRRQPYGEDPWIP